jgi:hypothetical protein
MAHPSRHYEAAPDGWNSDDVAAGLVPARANTRVAPTFRLIIEPQPRRGPKPFFTTKREDHEENTEIIQSPICVIHAICGSIFPSPDSADGTDENSGPHSSFAFLLLRARRVLRGSILFFFTTKRAKITKKTVRAPSA